jgi:hypothetical protein
MVPSWFTMSLLILSHSICSLCWSSMCFVHPFNLVGCRSIRHSSLTFIFALPFLVLVISATRWWKRPPRDACLFVSIHGKGLGNIIRKTHNQSRSVGLPKIFKHGTRSYSTSINMIVSCTCTCSCKGLCSISACIGPQHSCGPISWDHCDLSPSSSIGWGWPPPFCWQLSSKDGSCFG